MKTGGGPIGAKPGAAASDGVGVGPPGRAESAGIAIRTLGRYAWRSGGVSAHICAVQFRRRWQGALLAGGSGVDVKRGPDRVSVDSRRAASLAELLVVLGVLALLFAILLPPLQVARRQSMSVQCAANLQQIGFALREAHTTTGFYPFWDDGGQPIRYTWIDVLIQNRYLTTGGGDGPGAPGDTSGTPPHVAYCPADALPDELNEARHADLVYPLDRNRSGVDYSYGIDVPLSAGAWAWQPTRRNYTGPSRRLRGVDRDVSGRILAGDAVETRIYNLNGQALRSNIWNDPTQYDNTVAWKRHLTMPESRYGFANLLFQDGHVKRVRYHIQDPVRPVDTAFVFVWRPHEPIDINPDDQIDGAGYPGEPPPNAFSTPPGDTFPPSMMPRWYTESNAWTLIRHK